MRINYRVAQDCPLYHQRPKRKRLPKREHTEDDHEPIKDHVTADDVKHILKGEDFPIIEFAGPRGSGSAASSSGDEEVLEVEAIEVEPIKDVGPKTKGTPKDSSRTKTKAKPMSEGATSHKPDPEELVQEIMEELDFPDGSEDDEETDEPPEPEDEPVEEGAVEEELVKKAPRVEKKAVHKRKPKGGKK
jgi:hypothetical protein